MATPIPDSVALSGIPLANYMSEQKSECSFKNMYSYLLLKRRQFGICKVLLKEKGCC